MSIPARERDSRQRGMATEFIILLVLAMIGAFTLYTKFGATVAEKTNDAGGRVDELDVDAREPSLAATGSAASVARGVVEGGGGASAPLPEVVGAEAARSGEGLDTRTFVLLGILVVAVGMMMIVTMAQRVRKEGKKRKRV